MTDGAFTRRLTMLLDALNEAPTRFQAALVACHLWAALSTVRERDPVFEQEWNQLLGGHFTEVVSGPDARLILKWRHVWRAQEILQGLMVRQGLLDYHMGLPESNPARNPDAGVGVDG